MKKSPGFFITIEGGEGSGKSTLASRLFAYLTEVESRPVVRTREPGGTPFGVKVRELLLEDHGVSITPRAELFLFLADRSHHVETLIKPALSEGKIVICDRFNDSSVAYQGAARKIDVSQLENICRFAVDGLTPDLTFYLDLDPEIALARIKRGMDRMEKEKIDFHKRVRAGYLGLARENPRRIFVIDAALSPDRVFEESLKQLKICCKIG